MTTVYTTHPRYTEHDFPGHPEHAGRIQAVWRQFEETGLTSRLQCETSTPINEAQILSVHTSDYLGLLKWTQSQERTVRIDPDTYALPLSYDVACLSAGGVIQAVDAVLSGRANNGLAAVRPPGHHATQDRGMGFCLLSNIAITARYAQQHYDLQRVLILDYDVHHGNGTQDIFYDDDSVLFISTHQYPFYPGTGAIGEVGTGKGQGYTLNIPLSQGHGDKSYTEIFKQIVWPAAERFQPELILVSAGFDAHWSDPLAMMRLTLTGYAHLSRELVAMADKLCEGKIVFVMEGGYDLKALTHGMQNIAHVLLGEDAISDPYGAAPGHEPEVSALIERIVQLHRL